MDAVPGITEEFRGLCEGPVIFPKFEGILLMDSRWAFLMEFHGSWIPGTEGISGLWRSFWSFQCP